MSSEDSKVKIDIGSVASEYIQNSSVSRTGNSTKPLGSNESSPQEDVRLGSDVSRLSTLASEVMQLPETRDARVQELRSALLQGKYSAPAQDIAANVIDEMFARSR